MRSIEHVAFGPDALVGTCHMPDPARRRRIGALLLNAGYVPRDGHAGLAVKVCDGLASQGFPAFRFDLPMLGDSPGEPPVEADQLFEMVYRGDFADPTIAIARELRRRHGLDGLIVGGLCGAAVTAIYAADRDPASIAGLALFEPELYRAIEKAPLTPDVPAPDLSPRGRARRMVQMAAGKLFSYWGWMRVLTLENRFGRYLPLPRERILDLVLQRDRLPSVTNMPLVAAFRRVVDQRRPALIITAQGKLRELFFDRISGVVLAGAPTSHLTRVRLPGTNHIFTTGSAIDDVTRLAVDWATRSWPQRGDRWKAP